MGDPELKQNAVIMIAGIMNQLSNAARKEFFLTVGLALMTAYGPDDASSLTEAIVEEHSRLEDTN